MSETFKPMGLALASVVAGLPTPADAVKSADEVLAARAAEADALAASAKAFAPAEPFAEPAPRPRQGDLFDL